MFNIFLMIFLLLSPVLFLPLSIPGLPSLQFYQFGYFGNSIGLSQYQLFHYMVIILFIAALFDRHKRIFESKFFASIFLISILSFYLHPKTVKFFPAVFLGFLLYYLVVCYADHK